MFKIAEDMGQTVEWVMTNMSMIELQGWAKYHDYKAKAARKK